MDSPRIIIADDDHFYSIKARDALQEIGFYVESFDNGLDAYRRLQSHPPELLIISETIPKVNTFEFCRQVKAGLSIPIILVSQRMPADLAAEWPRIDNFVDYFLVKPYSTEELTGKTREFLRSRGQGQTKPSSRREVVESGGESRHKDETTPESSARFQQELEEKALVIARLNARNKELERNLDKASDDGPSSGDALKSKFEEMRLEMASKDLRLAEMEVKLEELLRLKTDFDEKAQDIIEQKTRDERALRKKYEGLVSERESLELEFRRLGGEMEQAVVEKEKIEERLQSGQQGWEKDRVTLQKEVSSGRQRVSKLEEELAWLTRVKDGELSALQEKLEREVADREASIEELMAGAEETGEAPDTEEAENLRVRIGDLEKEVERSRGEAGEAGAALESSRGEMEALQDRIREMEEAREGSAVELEDLKRRLEEEAESRRKAVEEKEKLVARLAGLEADSKDTAEQESIIRQKLEEEKEKAEGYRSKIEELEPLLREKEASIEKLMAGATETGEAPDTEEAENLRVRIGDLEKEVERSRGEAGEAGAALESSRGEMEALQDRIREMEEAREGSAVELEDLKRRLEEEAESRRKAVEEKEKLVARLAGLEADSKDTVEQESIIRQKLEEEKEKAEGYRSRMEEMETVRAESRVELESLNRRLEEEAESRRKAVEEKEKLVTRLTELEADFRDTDQQDESFRKMVEEEKDWAEVFRWKIEELESLLREKEESREKIMEEASSLRGNLERVERSLAAEKAAKKAVEEEFQLQLLNEKEEKSEVEGRLREMTDRLRNLDTTEAERFDQLREKLVEAVRTAQDEIIERSRAEADLAARLESQEREKEEHLKRLEGELSRAEDREKRLQELLERSMNIPRGVSSNLPARISSGTSDSDRRLRLWTFAGLALAVILLLASLMFSLLGRRVPTTGVAESGPAGAPAGGMGEENRQEAYPGGVGEAGDRGEPGEIWRKWTRQSASGGVILQATMRSPEELNASLEAEADSGGWSSSELTREINRRQALFDFEKYYYFYLYTKNLEAGYPSYADNLHRHVYLRDDAGNEVEGRLPEDMAEGKIIYSHSPGPLAKESRDLMYEVAAWIIFPREYLSPEPGFIQLIAYDIGTTSRRVLTWEIAGAE